MQSPPNAPKKLAYSNVNNCDPWLTISGAVTRNSEEEQEEQRALRRADKTGLKSNETRTALRRWLEPPTRGMASGGLR
jgi:predicted amidohydrolase YtcJ